MVHFLQSFSGSGGQHRGVPKGWGCGFQSSEGHLLLSLVVGVGSRVQGGQGQWLPQ